MTDPENSLANEDKRHPKAIIPYALLWIICIVCVIFACVAMLNQG